MKTKLSLCLIALLAIFVSFPLMGQEIDSNAEIDSSIDTSIDTSVEPRAVVHRLSWHPVDYALRYEAVVQVKTIDDEWAEVTRRITGFTDTFIDTPLFIGNYRFMVIVYDLLGHLGAESDWLSFDVRPGPHIEEPVIIEEQLYIEQPVITEIEPVITPAELSLLQRIIEEPEDEVIINLETERPARSIFRAEFAYQPLIVLPFTDFNDAYSSSLIQPIGFGIRLSAMPIRLNNGYIGLEINPSLHMVSNYFSGPSLRTEIVNLPVSIVWHMELNSDSAIEFRIGWGMTYVNHSFNSSHGETLANIADWNKSLQLGISYNYFLNERLFLNAGLDYLHIFTDEMSINYLRPSLALGWWF